LGRTVAMRTPAGVTWMLADKQGTVNVTVDNASQAVAIRRQDPFGAQRGSVSGTWPAADTRGYVNGTSGTDGLTLLGAREYDPTLGRFTATAPTRPTDQPQRYDPYTYCSNNPVGAADPTGTSSSSDAGWTFEFSAGPFTWDADGYRFQEIDLVYFWCKDN